MEKIEIAKSDDRQETILRIIVPSSFPSRPQLHIGWIGQSKSLGPKGWVNAPYPITPNSSRAETYLLITLDAKITNNIQAGTGVEISIPDIGVSEQLVWPYQMRGSGRWDFGNTSLGERFDAVSPGVQTEAAVGRDEGELEVVRAQLKAARDQLEKERNRPAGHPQLSTLGTQWWKVVGAFLVGALLGISAIYTYDGLERNGPPDRDTQSIAQLQRDLAGLKTAAFAPLATDLIQAAERSPKGETPDQVAGQGLPPDKVDVVQDRARTFLNHGLDMAGSRNSEEAVYWYKQAVRLCPADAMLYLGDAYFNGDGAPRDSRTGFQLMRISSSFGSRRATDLIKEMLRRQQIPLATSDIGDLYQSGR
jgi:hypothetical protein